MSFVLVFAPLPADARVTRADLDARLRRIGIDDPLAGARDGALARGDGVFETIAVVDHSVQSWSDHLARFLRSARILDLPAPHPGQWEHAIATALEVIPARERWSLRLTLGRGTPETGVTAWLQAEPARVRTLPPGEGLAVVSLARGLSIDAGRTTPWLLSGAKTLSYAVNMAALREAKRRGADDVIFTSTDGFALEGPTSSLLVRVDGRFLSPEPADAILPGTTVVAAIEWLRSRGFSADYERVPVDLLGRVDAAWLISSLRLAAPVRTLDGRDLARSTELTASLNDALNSR